MTREHCTHNGHDPRTRREFLRGMAAALRARWPPASRRPVAEPQSRSKHPKPTADTCILLWMAGGMAAPETFDPKRTRPSRSACPSEKILCTFPAIDTVGRRHQDLAGPGAHRRGAWTAAR